MEIYLFNYLKFKIQTNVFEPIIPWRLKYKGHIDTCIRFGEEKCINPVEEFGMSLLFSRTKIHAHMTMGVLFCTPKFTHYLSHAGKNKFANEPTFMELL